VAGRGAADDERTDLLLATVRELAGELHGDGPAPVVRPTSRLDRELGLDSLAMAELLTRVERRFDVHLPDEVLATAQTPADLLQAIGAAPPRPTDDAGATPTGRPAQGQPAATGPARDADTLVEVLDHHAAGAPDRVHLRILDDEATVEVTHAQLFQDAAAVAAGLRDRGVGAGSVVAIMLPTSRDYFATFAGVLLAGAVPAPLYPPARPAQLEEHLRRHVRILDNAQAPMLVTVEEVRRVTRLISPQVPSLEHVVTVDELRPAGGVGASPAAVGPQATGLLQYTSGSTGDPKGVVLSHANLLANIRAMCEAGEVDGERDVFVSWLPLYHDMGLIGAWFTSLYVGMPLVVMSPVAFLARPARWLRAIHEHGGTISGAPNFGYELAVKRIADEDLSGVDLSGWRVAFNGAEPVNPGTLRRFEERFAPHGLDRRALAPVYGLAECSVGLTIPRMGRGPVIDRITRSSLARGRRLVTAAEDDPDPAEFPACGRPLPGHELRIVDEQGREVEERTEGRIQFRGPSATSGYHRNPEATRALFDGDWLDTGDLGYLAGGELYPTGRVKDLIIRAGRNLHPAEVEDAVGAIDDVRTGCVAVFAASDEAGGTERLVVLAETRVTDEQRLTDLRRAIVERVTDVTSLPPDEVVLVGPGVVPKTSSGKIRRAAARERFETDALEESTPAVWRQVLRLGRGSAVPAATGAVRRAAARCRGCGSVPSWPSRPWWCGRWWRCCPGSSAAGGWCGARDGSWSAPAASRPRCTAWSGSPRRAPTWSPPTTPASSIRCSSRWCCRDGRCSPRSAAWPTTPGSASSCGGWRCSWCRGVTAGVASTPPRRSSRWCARAGRWCSSPRAAGPRPPVSSASRWERSPWRPGPACRWCRWRCAAPGTCCRSVVCCPDPAASR
jgi:acyl-CoA synthetase (AMP-forming)/AMP-acid ligase II/acyl carrier protein